jgi:negative regulator of sigma E activity
MAQVQQEHQEVDPITQSFIVDRQAFWTRFTRFTVNAVIAIVVLVVVLWWFVA